MHPGSRTTLPATETAKRLWHIVRAVFVMIREGLAKRRLIADLHLHLLLRRSKIAAKSLRSLLSLHQASIAHGGAAAAASLSCRFMDPDAAVYVPREVEFSCSNTPFYAGALRGTHRRRRRRHGGHQSVSVARLFELLDSVDDDDENWTEDTPVPSVLATPATAVRPLRVSDSPFSAKEEEEDDADEAVDNAAEEFIRRFYEQLRCQQMRASSAGLGFR
ncbi:hypothetical protein AXF42_Ash000429 [Apostasia shenzhenica]|uniref:Uncharacterized protein n=1 Tax=Apostasia shenzhenica TaxID=1088818 RepID=A0A2I0AGC2_9ASPA|nr:hypothetical protein AXF42_Ash000429 [Apostasia shenzhenica]